MLRDKSEHSHLIKHDLNEKIIIELKFKKINFAKKTNLQSNLEDSKNYWISFLKKKKNAPRFCARPGSHPDTFLAISGVSIPQQKSASAKKKIKNAQENA